MVTKYFTDGIIRQPGWPILFQPIPLSASGDVPRRSLWHTFSGLVQRYADYGSEYTLFCATYLISILKGTPKKLSFANRLRNCFI